MSARATAGGTAALLAGKTLLIFDFDGTIAATTPLHASAFAQVLAPYGIPVDYPSIAGMKTVDAILRSFRRIDREPPECAELTELVVRKQRLVREAVRSGLECLPGAGAFVERVRHRYRLAMVTSGSRQTVELALTALALRPYFDPLICAEDVRRAKPDPEGFTLALATCGVEPRHALVFEDSAAGFEAADAAGIEWLDVRDFSWPALLEAAG